jgi:hypothetical protein
MRRYEIRVEGILDERWSSWFGGLGISTEGAVTVIRGELEDEPALHGLLARINDLGLVLVSVRRLPEGPPRAADADDGRSRP